MSSGASARPIGGGSQSAGRRPRHKLLGWALLSLGLLLVLLFVADLGYASRREAQLTERFHQQVAALPPPPSATTPVQAGPAVDPHPVDGVDFVIKVSKIGYEAAVQEGVADSILAGGPGHYETTAWPGQAGNVGVAAHNVYWIRFNDLTAGDSVVLQTRWGDYTYRVTGKQIVNPDNREVLAPTSHDQLTLTTCWPLWAGAFATQRLIIFGEQVDPAPHQLSGL